MGQRRHDQLGAPGKGCLQLSVHVGAASKATDQEYLQQRATLKGQAVARISADRLGCLLDSHHAQRMARRKCGLQLLEHQGTDALNRLCEHELEPGAVELDAGRLVP